MLVPQSPREADQILKRRVCGIEVALPESQADKERKVRGRERALRSQPRQRALELPAGMGQLATLEQPRDHHRPHFRVFLPAGDELLRLLDPPLPDPQVGEPSKRIGGQGLAETTIRAKRGLQLLLRPLPVTSRN